MTLPKRPLEKVKIEPMTDEEKERALKSLRDLAYRYENRGSDPLQYHRDQLSISHTCQCRCCDHDGWVS